MRDEHELSLSAGAEAVREVLGRRLRDRELVEDLCQETMVRVLDSSDRLDDAAVVSYAVAIAKNLVIDKARADDVRRRHLHHLDTGHSPERPDEALLRREDQRTVAAALARLPEQERSALVDHVVDGHDVATLAAATGSTSGAVAARLSRARARMRVEYVVAARRVTLPTTSCHPVLVALSASDHRRQRAVGAAGHLADCSTCAELAPPLVERQHRLVGLVPLPILAVALGRLRYLVNAHPAAATAAGGFTAATAAVGVAVAMSLGGASPQTALPTSAPTTQPVSIPSPLDINGQPLLPAANSPALTGLQGGSVVAREVPVLTVPAAEGFWVGLKPEQRIWVQFLPGTRPAVQIQPGQKLSFNGRLVGHGAGFGDAAGLDPSDGSAELDRDGAHIEVDAATIIIKPN